MMKSYHASQVSTLEYKQKVEKFYSKLTPQQYSSIMYYSDSGHKKANYASTVLGCSIAEDINTALQFTQESMKTVYRASDDFLEADLHVGNTIMFPAFVSTSYNPQIPFKFLNKQQPIIYVIETQHGAEISTIHDEMEVLLPKGLQFKIMNKTVTNFHAAYPDTDYHIVKENITTVYLKEVTSL